MNNTIEEAKFVLKRNTEWISNCDSKATTVLAFVGVLITIVCSNDNFLFLKDAILSMVNSCSLKMLFLVAFVIFSTLFSYGIYEMINVLFARIDAGKYRHKELVTDSKIFFGSISNNVDYSIFYHKFIQEDDSGFLNDLLSQVYITSIIANSKYTHYNTGLKFLILGFTMLIAEAIIYSFWFM